MSFTELARILRNASNLVVLTGAGISTPSGIPDFRSDKNGLWTQVDPLEVASLSAFRTNPEKFYAWIQPLVGRILQATPNAAHYALADLEAKGICTTVITQNIDGLHQRAGSKHVLEVHGSLSSLSCANCSRSFDSTEFMTRYLDELQLPYCPECGYILKPDVILYEEQLPRAIWKAAEQALANCDVFLVAGSSLEVLPVAGLPARALDRGADLIIINHTATYLDDRAAATVHADLAVCLPAIANEIH